MRSSICATPDLGRAAISSRGHVHGGIALMVSFEEKGMAGRKHACGDWPHRDHGRARLFRRELPR
jgi:hypothetical protein